MYVQMVDKEIWLKNNYHKIEFWSEIVTDLRITYSEELSNFQNRQKP